MLLRLCQLKSQLLVAILLLSVSACSWRKTAEHNADEFISSFSNKWFSANSDHSLVDSKGVPVPHVLFDTTPEFNEKAQTANVIITTPKDSEHYYRVHTNSGQVHYSHSFCKQKDVWNLYSGSINRPNFSVGHIPRILDQLGEPQKIVIWSNRAGYGQTWNENYFKVKIIGAYVEQICPEGNCIGKSNWLSRLVFIAVDNEDNTLRNLQATSDFKKVVNWESAKAQLENMEGRNFIGENTYPYIRVGQLIEFKDAFEYFKKRSIFLVDGELKKIQKGCHALYTSLWEEVGKVHPEDKPARTKEELNAKIKLRAELKKKKLPVGFAARLHRYTQKFYNEVSTCEKFVYHGNLNKNPEAFWFLSHMGIFYRLHREGYYYNCGQKTWQRNSLDRDGRPVHNIKRDITKCTERDIDRAMEYLPNFLSSLKGEPEYFKFIDYDQHTFGTHKKMYAWVKMKNRKFDCRNDVNEEIQKETKVFPEDAAWKPRYVKDLADELKIIY